MDEQSGVVWRKRSHQSAVGFDDAVCGYVVGCVGHLLVPQQIGHRYIYFVNRVHMHQVRLCRVRVRVRWCVCCEYAR